MTGSLTDDRMICMNERYVHIHCVLYVDKEIIQCHFVPPVIPTKVIRSNHSLSEKAMQPIFKPFFSPG